MEYTHEILSDDEITRQIVDSRNEEIRRVESDMVNLSEIFQDLAIMIDIQGEQIEIAVINIEESSVNVEESVLHIEKAVQYQSSFRTKLLGGAIVCGSVTLGGIGLAFLSPIAGIVAAGVGLTGTIGCIGYAFRSK